MKKIITIILLFFSTIITTFAGENELSIINIDSSNSNILKIFVDNDIEANSVNLTSDLKLFKDLQIENASRDLENDSLVKIVLKDKLEKNTSYSLLPIFGVEGSIDFEIEDIINGLEIKGSSLDGVEKLTIVDSKHIDVIFKEKITGDKVELKILKEYGIDSIKLNPENKKEIQVFLKKSLEDNKKYLIMIFSIVNSDNVEYSIKNYIYDFEAKVSNTDEVRVGAGDIDPLKKESELKKTALNSASTPDTGPETWILILFTFIFSTIVFIRRKKI